MDTVANLLSIIKNAYMVNKPSVEVVYSKHLEAISEVLESKGFIKKVKTFKFKGKAFKGLHLDLAYDDSDLPVLMDIKRVSKPVRRIYKKASEIKSVNGGHGLLVISTPRGVMSDEDARKKRLGGEVICKVW